MDRVEQAGEVRPATVAAAGLLETARLLAGGLVIACTTSAVLILAAATVVWLDGVAGG